MDFITSKAMIIAVGIFVTVIITSSVFIILGYVLDIYGNVSKIDYAYLMQFGEFDRYNNVTLSGVEALNMCNKFKDNANVKFIISGKEVADIDTYIKANFGKKYNASNDKYYYSDAALKNTYTTRVEEDAVSGIVKITMNPN